MRQRLEEEGGWATIMRLFIELHERLKGFQRIFISWSFLIVLKMHRQVKLSFVEVEAFVDAFDLRNTSSSSK